MRREFFSLSACTRFEANPSSVLAQPGHVANKNLGTRCGESHSRCSSSQQNFTLDYRKISDPLREMPEDSREFLREFPIPDSWSTLPELRTFISHVKKFFPPIRVTVSRALFKNSRALLSSSELVRDTSDSPAQVSPTHACKVRLISWASPRILKDPGKIPPGFSSLLLRAK